MIFHKDETSLHLNYCQSMPRSIEKQSCFYTTHHSQKSSLCMAVPAKISTSSSLRWTTFCFFFNFPRNEDADGFSLTPSSSTSDVYTGNLYQKCYLRFHQSILFNQPMKLSLCKSTGSCRFRTCRLLPGAEISKFRK